jgi:cytochrome c peroxidase
MLAGDETAMTPATIRGARRFVGKAACTECHRGGAFSDGTFHNIGCPQEGEHVYATALGHQGAITKADGFNRASVFSDPLGDTHLQHLTASAADIGAFKTPTLRNVARTAPYMQDGVYGTLEFPRRPDVTTRVAQLIRDAPNRDRRPVPGTA